MTMTVPAIRDKQTVEFCFTNAKRTFSAFFMVRDCVRGTLAAFAGDVFHSDDARFSHALVAFPENVRIAIQPATPAIQYNWMRMFLLSIKETHEDAFYNVGAVLSGRGVFRAFRDGLDRYDGLTSRWMDYRANLLRRHILQWFAKNGVEFEVTPWSTYEPSEPEELDDSIFRNGETSGNGDGDDEDEIFKQLDSLEDSMTLQELREMVQFAQFIHHRRSRG